MSLEEKRRLGVHLLDFLAEVSEPHHTSWAGPAVEMMKRTTTNLTAPKSLLPKTKREPRPRKSLRFDSEEINNA